MRMRANKDKGFRAAIQLRILALVAAGIVPAVASAASAQELQAGWASISETLAGAQVRAREISAASGAGAYPIRGADVSRYQGNIDWDKLKTAALSFVYIKSTESDHDVDPQFARNWEGASRAGIAKGAYHFYDFCKSGAAQADHFIRTVPREPGALPPTIDLEKSGSCHKMPEKDAFLADLAVFVAKIQAAYGQKPILYVNGGIHERYLTETDADQKLWISAPVNEAPQLPDGRAWTLWQYTFSGRLAGIEGPVDIDVFNGTPAMLAALTRPDAVLLALKK
jgi:lysozyme